MRSTIGGVLDYAVLSQVHRPKTAEALRLEVQRLARNGLTANDIATALRLDIRAVRELLVATPAEAEQACREAWTR